MSDDDDYINQMKDEIETQKVKNLQLNTALASSSFQAQEQGNLIQYQLDSTELLSRIEHFLRGDIIKTDDDGNQYYESPKDTDLVLLNDYGINSLMAIISNYIDKSTFLSFYDEERINEILADLGEALADFIFCNYEKMGMDTDRKKSRFNLIVLNILHMCESAYRRALRGKEREEIHSTRLLTQTDIIGRPNPSSMPNKSRFNLFKPKTW